MSKLPDGWIHTTLGDLSAWASGGTPRRSNPAYFGGDIPWVTISDLNDGLVSSTVSNITAEGLQNSSAKLIPSGSILIALYGSIGKLGIAGTTLATNQAIAHALPNDEAFDSKYVFYYLYSERRNLLALGSGVTQKNIYLGDLKNYSLPLPPRAEQTRIVDKLEELLSDLDAGVSELSLAIKKLDQYRQALLKSTVEGLITEKWRQNQKPTQTGAQLLNDILFERRARWESKQLKKFMEQGKTPPKLWKEKYPEPAQADITDLPELPKGWIWSSLDQLTEIQGGIQKQPSRAPIDKKYPFLRVANVFRGKLKLDIIHEIELFDGELTRNALQKGDILIVEGNGSLSEIGRCAVWDGSIPDAVHQNHLIRARPIQMRSEFIESWINSVRGIEKLSRLAATTSGLYTLSIRKISRIPVPVPPLAEQNAAIDFLKVALEEHSAQVVALQMSLKQLTAQRQRILKSAFEGKLVPQRQDDEPAPILLELIRIRRAEPVAPSTLIKKMKQKEKSYMPLKLIEVLKEAGDWLTAQEAFRRCGVGDGALTEQVETLYAELRDLDKAGRLGVEVVVDSKGRKVEDRLKILEV